MDDVVAAALDGAFPGRAVETVEETGPSWNEENRTVRVEFVDGEAVYLKTTTGNGTRFARERAVVAYVAATTEVPVPTVPACDPDGSVPYLVTAPVEGESLLGPWYDRDVAERLPLARAVGRTLARVHGLRFEGHGRVVGGNSEELELNGKPWPDLLVEQIREARRIAPSERFGRHYDAVVATVEANRDLLSPAPATLCHGDPAIPNCFLTDGEVGLLDWERAHVGDPARDLYRTRRQQLDAMREDAPEELVGALYDGYREVAGGLPEGFAARRPVYEAVWFLSYSGFFDNWVEFRDEPRGELAEWVEAGMKRRLAAIR
ncbi:phosphotransferase family protein [Halomarina litorea]|uniref:phosphotransferase family protein n=1 Tax=Halomarina litorea TaxID=2961595 RepID=UPI0020C40AFC|nr:phosphotransferase [Halomarina sp. BCD28]